MSTPAIMPLPRHLSFLVRPRIANALALHNPSQQSNFIRQPRLLSTRAKSLQSQSSWRSSKRVSTARISIPEHVHSFTTAAIKDNKYEACVVGAGPAGVTVLGNLLQRGIKPILWVDDNFTAGRINARYREVPSNTKAKLFTEFATAVSPFRDIVGLNKPAKEQSNTAALNVLRDLDPEKGCQLSHAADMVLMLTEGLRQYPGVEAVQGRLTAATLDAQSGTWKVQVRQDTDQSAAQVAADRLVLCTGSSPNNSPLPVHIPGIEYIDLDAALSPTKLTQLLSSAGKVNIAVIGASHSAILVLRNLYHLARDSKADIKIKWFTRHDLRYAEFMDGWILRDNTGLKGEAATWAKENLEPETMPKSDVSNYVEKISYQKGDEKTALAEHLADVQYYVQAIGFDRDPIPDLSTTTGDKIQPQFNHEDGTFTFAGQAARKIKGLFGAGIAWPERVTDPYGNVEYAVGFFKFMKFVKRVSPAWN